MNRHGLWLALALLPGFSGESRATSTTTIWIKPLVHDCAFAVDDTVRVDVMLNAIVDSLDDVGCSISYDAARLEFQRAKRGALIGAWSTFTASDNGTQITINASDPTPIPSHVSGQFASLVFVAKTCGSPSTETISLCVPATTGDIAGIPTVCGDVTVIPGAPGSLSVESIYHTCSGAAMDTVEVDIRVENAPQLVDAAGFDILYDPGKLEYVGYRRGALTDAWLFFDAAKLVGLIRVGGFTTTAIPGGTSGVFVTLRFVVSCCDGAGTSSLCTQTLVDDFASLSGACGAVVCVPLATRPSTWGYVKSLYR